MPRLLKAYFHLYGSNRKKPHMRSSARSEAVQNDTKPSGEVVQYSQFFLIQSESSGQDQNFNQ